VRELRGHNPQPVPFRLKENKRPTFINLFVQASSLSIPLAYSQPHTHTHTPSTPLLLICDNLPAQCVCVISNQPHMKTAVS